MRSICLFIIGFALTATIAPAATRADDPGIQFFESKIRPLLVENCYKCHSVTAKKLKANLYLDSREGLIKGGDNGPAIVPGHADQGKLIEAISWTNPDLQMPPKAKLNEQQQADLVKWVAMGAPWPAEAAPRPVATVRVFNLQERKASHWCWKPIVRTALPAVKDVKWAQSPIDRFILAKLEQAGLQHAGPADRQRLIRRAYFDIIGLPPTAQEVEAFVNDPAPDAFAKVVDHLLASEHFGERWSRHWMDIVRYGETRGHEYDPLIPNAWQYRDYLIRAFNADVPYSQFVTEHIAGDLLPSPRLNPEKGFDESILGTGFWFLGEEVHSPVDIRQDEADRLNNRIDTMTKAFLGLTVGCARCHDHKFDAISQKDFYALTGFTLSAGYRQVPFMSMEQNRHVAEQLDALRTQAKPKLIAELLSSERPGLSHVADYLLACRQVLMAGGPRLANVTEIAAGKSLDVATLREWLNELAIALKDPSHPLYDFASLLHDKTDVACVDFTPIRQKLIDRWNTLAKSSQAPPPAQVILDFDAQSPTAPWYSDGVAFGLRSIRAGEAILGSTADASVLGVARRGMARSDPAFNALHAARGTETDYSRLGGVNRAGRTIRTPKVTLKTGQLWYLVRGAGFAYAVVDSHLMIGGPLHGKLLQSWKDNKGKWTWIHQNLADYAGHRCHIEFTPEGDGGLEISKVIETDQPPAADEPNTTLCQTISDASVTSYETLASAYQKLFTSATDRLVAGTICGSTDACDQAALADFVVQHSKLFVPAMDLAPQAFPIAKRFIAEQSSLASRIVTESPTALAMWDGNGIDENVLIRGVAKNTGEVVPRRFLEAIAGANQKPYPIDGSGRLQLAEAMLAQDDPFISRVMVNRVWQHLFGRGIVPTVDNFGVLGQLPTHPELLDYLADNFRKEQGWSIKKLIRSIVLSNTYQMSSKVVPASEQSDPQNLLLHHMPVRRLEAEPIRDAILAVSGRFDPTIFGKPMEVYVTQFMEGRGRPGSGPLDGAGRRSIYIRIRRNFLSPMMLAFDMPIPFACVGRRNVSNVPAQALILMNDPFVVEEASLWAKRLLAEPGKSPKDRITAMYLTALSREPKPNELQDALAFLDRQGEAYSLSPEQRMTDPRAWADLCHVMFNLKEFIFIE